MGLSIPVVQPHTHPGDIIKDVPRKDLDGLNIVFINMPLRENAVPVNTPEGIMLMATNLRDNYGVHATIIDLNAYRIKDERAVRDDAMPIGRHLSQDEAHTLIQKHFSSHGEPVLVALSGMITTLRWQKRVAKIVRELSPDVFLVSGNGLATELKEGLFAYIPELDGVAHSEGDDVVVKICYDAKVIKQYGIESALLSGKLDPYYLGPLNSHHRFVYGGDRPLNLDVLPFADMGLLASDVLGNPLRQWFLNVPIWGLASNNSSATPWQDEDVIPKTQSVSSRGCPYQCKYCFRGAQGERSWGVRSAEHIAHEIAHNKEHYGITFHGFPDDNFAVNPKRIADLIPLLGPLGVKWGTHTRLDEAADILPNTGQFASPLRVELMAKSGCVYIGFGPESASEMVLEAIGKGGHTLSNGFVDVIVDGRTHSFPRSMVDGIRNTVRAGIHSNCTWIFASPTETLEALKETVLFIMWQTEFYTKNNLPPESVNKRMFTMTWYPGTTLINNDKVRKELIRVFGLSFQPARPNTSGVQWEPVIDDKFYKYLIELDDATKVLHGEETDEPLNFGDMSTDTFLKAREHIDNQDLFGILNM